MYYTYILYSSTFDRIYIGQTDNLGLRLERHKSGKVKSTKAYIPWEMIYYKECATGSLAMKREKELKTHKGRDFIRQNLLNGSVRQ